MKKFKLILFMSLLALAPMASHGATFDVVGSGNLDAAWDDLDHVTKYGDVLMLRDLQVRGTLNTDSGFYSSIQLACDQQKMNTVSDCFSNAKQLAKDVLFGYAKTIDGQEFLIVAGKGSVAFGDSTTQRAIPTDDTIEQLDRQMWRKPIIMVKLTPSVSSDSRTGQILSIIKSIEVTAYNNKAGLTNDLSKSFSPDSYAARITYGFMKASGQVSYLHQQDGERRFDASVRAPLFASGFQVYANYQNLKNSVQNPDIKDATLVGVSHSLAGGDASLEASVINHKLAGTIPAQTYNGTQEKRLTAGYSHELMSRPNYNVVGKVELGGRVGDGSFKDASGAARLNVNFTSTAQTNNLFAGSNLEQRVKARNAALEKANAIRE